MSTIDLNTVRAIGRRDLAGYLANPTGYVFLTLFIATTGAAAFLQDEFFTRNLADLALLNQMMPAILMLFVPAVTMGTWAEERRAGTDELLLTMPVRDIEVVLGKYLGAVGVFTVGLAFSLAHLVVLAFLGSPDLGLMIATYLGYWVMGGLFVAVGLLGSMFTTNATVAFILGALGCSGLVFADKVPWASGVVGAILIGALLSLSWLVTRGGSEHVGRVAVIGTVGAVVLWISDVWRGFEDTFSAIGVSGHFQGFGEGVVRLGDLVYFCGAIGLVLYACSFLMGRRHW